jgi:peptide/nickel transport system ATP-binding protein
MKNKSLLDIQDLVTEFRQGGKQTKAIKGISFSVERGQTVGVVGESGSGKSVTSLSIMGLIPNPPGKITGGKIVLHRADDTEKDLAQASEEDLRTLRGKEMAMIFQEPMTSLNPVMTCGKQVQEALQWHQQISDAEAKSKTIELFSEVQLPMPEQMFDRYPHQLSGGQKQRVMIAMAMSCQPALLIADEPTTALDVTVQKTILELMKQLQLKYGIGIVFITHDLGVIAEIADKVVVMYKGEVVEQGSAAEVFSLPKHPYTKSLLACRPPMDTRPRRLPVVTDFIEKDEQGNFVERIDGANLKIELISSEERAAAHKKLYAGKKLIEIKHLNTWFPKGEHMFGKGSDYIKAVNDVSFDVYEGETLGLVGESGCGKSTLGRSILKLNQPHSGEILFEGKDILKLSEKEFRPYRSGMQLIFQDPYSALNPRLTVGEAIAEPMQVHGIFSSSTQRKNKVLELLNKVGLDASHFQRYPHEFSGGQRQRIIIARALALNPRFIICDESVSALDVSVQAQVLNLLNDLKREFGFTYIFISHDLSVVKYMSDRMVVMSKGAIEEMGDPDEIYRAPQTEYTRRLIESIPHNKLATLTNAGKKIT